MMDQVEAESPTEWKNDKTGDAMDHPIYPSSPGPFQWLS